MLRIMKAGAVVVVVLLASAWPAAAAVDRGEAVSSGSSDSAGWAVQADPHEDDERDGGLLDGLDELLDDLL